jgi:hypothetical protein
VLSKVLELLMFPVIDRFANEQGYELILATAQNQYPDITLVSKHTNLYYAVDIKTTFRSGIDRIGNVKVNGMTLGTFGGYFRVRDKPVSSRFAYNQYAKHYVLGVVYSQTGIVDERTIYRLADDQDNEQAISISDLREIPSVVKDFQFFLHEKYKVASDQPGSGNTKNIGSTRFLERLINGTGVFADLGIEVFDDYWMNYRTRAMAREEGFDLPPYTNLISYKRYKEQGTQILNIPDEKIQTEAGEISSDVVDDEI